MVRHQEITDLVLVQQFFTERGLQARRIPETTAKTTDFEILRGTERVAFCEMKSPQDVFVERLVAVVLQAPQGQYAGIVECGPVSRQYMCLERAAKKNLLLSSVLSTPRTRSRTC